MSTLFESCVDSLDAAVASERGGAGRIELCASLNVGGLTPDLDLISRCSAALKIPTFVMVRPRAGDFVYGSDDVHTMERDIAAVKSAGAHGIVMGALTSDRVVDVELMRRLLDLARPLPVTFHRAIDDARDQLEALDALISLGGNRVLTSGGAPTALEGADTLAKMVARAGASIVVMAGGKVRAHNVREIVRRTGVREVHAWLTESPDAVGELVRELAERRV